MEHARGVEQRGRGDRSAGVQRRDLILRDPPGDGPLEVRREAADRVLLDAAAERVRASVGAAEREPGALPSATFRTGVRPPE